MDFTEYDFTECDISDNIDELNSKNFESLRTRYLTSSGNDNIFINDEIIRDRIDTISIEGKSDDKPMLVSVIDDWESSVNSFIDEYKRKTKTILSCKDLTYDTDNLILKCETDFTGDNIQQCKDYVNNHKKIYDTLMENVQISDLIHEKFSDPDKLKENMKKYLEENVIDDVYSQCVTDLYENWEEGEEYPVSCLDPYDNTVIIGMTVFLIVVIALLYILVLK